MQTRFASKKSVTAEWFASSKDCDLEYLGNYLGLPRVPVYFQKYSLVVV